MAPRKREVRLACRKRVTCKVFAVDVGYDAAAKAVVITGTSGDDQVEVSWVKNGAADSDDQLVVKDHGKVVSTQNVWNPGEPFATPRILVVKFEGGKGDDSINVKNNVLPHIVSNVDQTIAVVLSGGEGSDTLSGANGDDLIQGGKDDDTITGHSGDDNLYGDGGNDTIYGDDKWGNESGKDQIWGGDNDDKIYGGNGNDSLWGGNDHLYGGMGNDAMVGGNGNDIMNGGFGSDIMYGDFYFSNDGFVKAEDPTQVGNDVMNGERQLLSTWGFTVSWLTTPKATIEYVTKCRRTLAHQGLGQNEKATKYSMKLHAWLKEQELKRTLGHPTDSTFSKTLELELKLFLSEERAPY